MIVPRPLKKVREKITPFSQEDKIPTFNLGSGTADSTTVLHGDGTWQPEGEGIPPGGTAGQLLAKESATDYDVTWVDQAPAASYTSVLKHTVKAGENLVKGQAVYVSSADGTNMVVSKASNTTEATSSKTMGLIAQDLSTNGKGFVITEGLLAGLDTSSTVAGAPVWLGTNGNLIYGLVGKPYAPAHLVFIGVVTRANNNNGEIFVKVQNGFELNEIHDVDLKSILPTDGQVLQFEGATGLWKNKTLATGLTVGTTAISGGVDGRVLFQNGGVLQESANLTIETTPLGILSLSSSTPSTRLRVISTNASPNAGISLMNGSVSSWSIASYGANMNFTFYNDFLSSDALFITRATNNIGIGTNAPSARLDVKAQGALSTDLAFRVRNSANTADLFKISGNGQSVLLNNSTESSLSVMDATNTFSAVTLENFSLINTTFKKVLGIQSYNPTGIRYLTMSSLDDLHWNHRFTLTGLLKTQGGIQSIGTSNDFNASTISQLYNLSMKNQACITLRPDLNLAISENLLGLFIAPNSTQQPTKKLIKLMDSTLTNTFFTVNGLGQTAIGTDTPTARLHIAAQGALSTDIALRVRNSANTGDLLSVAGNGSTVVSSLTATSAIAISQPAGAYYPSLSFQNNGGSNQGSITGYGGGLYTQTASYFHFTNISNVSVGGAYGGRENSAILQTNSTTKGFLPPRMTNAERTAIATPAVGLMVYCTDATEGLYVYKSTGWTFVI